MYKFILYNLINVILISIDLMVRFIDSIIKNKFMIDAKFILFVHHKINL